jgi:uncharacterized protein YkwD
MLYFLLTCNVSAQSQTSSTINKQQWIKMVNDVRAKGCNCGGKKYPAAPAVKWNENLEQAAQKHANDMYRYNYFSHTGKDGSTVRTRVSATGYQWVMCAENIGMNYKTESQVMQGWLNSPSHCEEIMNELFTEIGVAVKGKYWTMVLAWPKP